MPPIIRVLIVEKQKVISEGLKILLESASDIEVVGSVINSDAVLFQLEELKPNILLISKAASETDKFDVIKFIRQKYQQIKIIIFCSQVDASDFVQYLELGVNGCLLKNVSVGQIKEIIRYVNQGHTYIENSILQTVLPELSDAVSSLKIVESEFQESLVASESAVINNNKFQLYPSDYRQNNQFETIATPSYIPLSDEFETDNSPRLNNSEQKTKKTWWKREKIGLAVASLGFAAIAGLAIFFRRGTKIIINDAVVTGKIVAIYSPVAGELQKINYRQGMNIQANQLLASVKNAEDSKTTIILSQLVRNIALKQEQIKNEQELLSLFENNLKNLPQQSEISITTPQSSETSQILIDNTREIAKLQQQIVNQKVTINLLAKELSNLQERLNETEANLASNQITPIKAPISGVINQINYTEGELISPGQEIINLIDCQNLWIEAIIDSKTATKINLQNKVSVQLENRESLILGEVSLIESLSNQQSWHYRDRIQQNNEKFTALTSIIPANNQIKETFYRVIFNVNFSNSGRILKDFCGVGLTARISIN